MFNREKLQACGLWALFRNGCPAHCAIGLVGSLDWKEGGHRLPTRLGDLGVRKTSLWRMLLFRHLDRVKPPSCEQLSVVLDLHLGAEFFLKDPKTL